MKHVLVAFMIVGILCVLSAVITAMVVFTCDPSYYVRKFRKWLNGLVQ